MLSGYLILLIALATAVLPFVVGSFLARSFKMPDYGWKIGLILFALVASVVVIVTGGGRPNLGVDLSGGVIMVYEVLPSQDPDAGAVNMDELITAIGKRVNPGGVKEVSVRRYGEDAVEIIIPQADAAELDRIERKISRAGTLEFRILANTTDHRDIIDLAERSTSRQVRQTGKVVARWVPLEGRAREQLFGRPGLATRATPDGGAEALVVIDRQNVTGRYLRRVSEDVDMRNGTPCVAFLFDTHGADLFYALTSDNAPDPVSKFQRQLGIILDGELYSAPNLESPIAERGQITGQFTGAEVKDLVAVLQAGSLPATITEEPISSQVIGPTLGQDTIERGARAMLVSMIVVPLIVLIYYRAAGLVADMMMILMLLLVVATMMVFKAALTLPGLAGLVLSIGMAIDANVLIYERIREELHRGAALRMAIRNGFDRAMSAIIDSNVTTLITGVVLYAVGTDQVKGFAVTLILGLLYNMFTAVFCCRVIFDVAERRRWITKLHMMQLIGETNIDFLGKRRLAAGASIALIVVGMGAVYMRGSDLLNIDFTGGSKIEVLFNDNQDVAEVRAKVGTELPDVTVTDIKLLDETMSTRFQVVTSEPDKEVVEAKLVELFGERLAKGSMEFELAKITPEMLEAESPTTLPGPSATPPAAEPSIEAAPGEQPTPSEQPSPTPPADAPPAETPDDSPEPSAPEAETPPAAEPSSEPPADAPESVTPESGDNSGVEPRRGAGMDGELLAYALQDETPTEPTTPEPPAETSPADTETPPPAESTEESAPATETPPADAPAADEQPIPAQTAPEAERPDAEPATSDTTGVAAGSSVFLGGTQARIEFGQPVDEETVEDRLQAVIDKPDSPYHDVSYAISNLGPSVRSTLWQVRFNQPETETKAILDEVRSALVGVPVFPSAVEIGGQVADNTRVQALIAMAASLFATLVYIWVRFQKVSFGAAAIVATVHDVLITLGILALSKYVANALGFLLIDPFKVDLSIVAALLTLVGYSLNDTIVIFDRIREVRGKSPVITIDMLNKSVNQTLSRTLLTGSTTLLVILILYIGGGEGIHGFAFTLLIGIVTGTFSSVYIAAPVLLWLMGKQAPATTAARAPARAAV